MEHHGFIHDMLDVKVLILVVMSRVNTPTRIEKIYELCLQDDKLTYFYVCEAVPQMVTSGQLRETYSEHYSITDKGREVCSILQDQVAFPVVERAKAAVEEYNQDVRRDAVIDSNVTELPTGESVVHMELMDGSSKLMTLELLAPTLREGRKLEKIYHKRAEILYRVLMDTFLDGMEPNPDD